MSGTVIDRSAGVPIDRAWNSWSQDRPAEFVFLPLGVSVTPFASSSKAGPATLFAMSPSLRLGPRTVDGDHVDVELELGGTAIALSYRKPDPFSLCGYWKTVRSGEWGARFWMGFALHCESGEEWSWDEETETAMLKIGPRLVAVRCLPAPVLITGHPDTEAMVRELDERGYSYAGSRRNSGRTLALRFSLEAAADGCMLAAVGDDKTDLIKKLDAMAAEAGSGNADPLPPMHTGSFEGAFDAVRDTVAWNTIWDGINHRRHTCLSRSWSSQKFNGFGIWAIDLLYHAALGASVDPELARENLSAVLASATPQGNVACRTTGNDAWLDRGHPPLGGFIIWSIYLRLQDRSLLTAAFDTLMRNFDWWRRNRMPNDAGLLSYGSSTAGDGIYKGTKFAAKNESSMDNSPVHDEFEFDKDRRTLNGFDVGLNSLFVLEAEMLSNMARALGHVEQAEKLAAFAEEHRQRVRRELWDEKRKIFASRFCSGAFITSLAPTSFYPLLAGIADEEQSGHLLTALNDETLFGGAIGLPSVHRSHPTYRENVYWRGPVWPPLNYLVWQGLRRSGYLDQARGLAERSYRLFMEAWRDSRSVPENYDPETGWRDGQADTDWFYSWGALMPAMAAAELVHIDPWDGWTIHSGMDFELGPQVMPAGTITTRVVDGILSLHRGEQILMRTNVAGRITHITLDDAHFSAVLPAGSEGEWIEFPAQRDVLTASLDGRPLERSDSGHCRLGLAAAPSGKTRRLVAIFA